MKTFAAGLCAIAFGVFGCASNPSANDGSANDAEGELRTATKSLRCTADSGEELAVVATSGGKSALVALTPAADVYAVSRDIGSVTTSPSWSWKGPSSSLAVNADMSAKWKRGSKSTNVTCKAMPAAEAGSWRAANALADYGEQIDGLADTVVGEMSSHAPKAYVVFGVETAKRDSLALGDKVTKSGGALPGSDEAQSLLDENDSSYGPMSAAYSLGGGDDYGEWFQGASDGISLSGTLVPALGTGASAARGGFIAREKVAALSNLVDSKKPSAVEITVGAWTFFLPDAFGK